MAYTSYELLPARTINHRVVPRLYKLIRSNGTFDLYGLSTLQHNCMKYLASVNQAAVFAGRYNSDGVKSFGTYDVNTDSGNFIKFSIQMTDSTHYASYPNCSLRLKLDNNANIYPYEIKGYNYAGHNGGTRLLQVYNGSSWVTKAGGAYSQGNWGGGSNSSRSEATLWKMSVSDLTTVFDWKDYSQLNVMFRAVDTSKFTGAGASLTVTFVHRFTDGHPLHRYYR